MKKKFTYLIPSGPLENPDKKHLHIILTDPGADGNALAVSVSSWTNSLCDDACILDRGDHPFITHKSWVVYRNARLMNADDIQDRVKTGKIIRKEDLSDEVFDRVIAGCAASAKISKKIMKLFQQYLPLK